ncbi:Os03g0405550 [Oryza sativa Japonica Group]|uniref:Os03g0405550 protein n=1 Tax=Oryza sativa subsp. japonica TaxID=39947 RepID=A0A0P0VYK9_ORYSJ|nr:Os03g0405550 [Oryza sativa Japonica Group]
MRGFSKEIKEPYNKTGLSLTIMQAKTPKAFGVSPKFSGMLRTKQAQLAGRLSAGHVTGGDDDDTHGFAAAAVRRHLSFRRPNQTHYSLRLRLRSSSPTPHHSLRPLLARTRSRSHSASPHNRMAEVSTSTDDGGGGIATILAAADRDFLLRNSADQESA